MSLVDFIHGRLIERDTEGAVIALGGLGLRATLSSAALAALPEIGADATVVTTLIVREDALTLYGFASREERALFDQLLSVSGVGPKVALAALASGPVERLAAVIEAEDVKALARIPGIGQKTASRIVLELKGKLVTPTAPAAGVAAVGAPGSGGVYDLAAAALREFGGFGPAEVAAAVAALPRDRDLSEDEAVRLAFQLMNTRR